MDIETTSDELKGKIIRSFFWKILERGGLQIIQFVIAVLIARMLIPEDYGVVALVTVFISIATIFVKSGLSTALVQKKNATQVEFSSVFFYSLSISLALYIILFFAAPHIAMFYNMPSLNEILRVMALTLFPGAFNSVQLAYSSKHMQFKKQFLGSIIAAIISSIVGIGLAILNYGPWALVFQQLSYQVSVCIVMWFTVKWRPMFIFSFSKTQTLLSYGIRLLGANIIDTVYRNLENFIIGRYFSSAALAFYSKGKQFPLILFNNIDGSIQSVMMPALSIKQNELSDLKIMIRKTVSLSSYLAYPAMAGLAAIAQPLIILTLGKSWASVIPFLRIYCLIAALFLLQTTNLQAINALGRSDLFLKLMLAKRALGTLILFSSVLIFRDIFAIAWAIVISEIISIIVGIIPVKKVLNYSFIEQLQDVAPNFILSFLMGIIVYSVTLLNHHYLIVIFVQIISGIMTYIILSLLFNRQNLLPILFLVNKFIRKFFKG